MTKPIGKKTIGVTMLGAACLLVSVTAWGDPCDDALETIATFETGDIPESVALDRAGNAYLSIGNTIRLRTPRGAESTFATLPITASALGVKIGPDGCVYNASTSLDPAVVGAFVWRTCRPGTAERYATLDPSGAPNDLAFDDDGNLFVTDPFLGRVYKVRPDGNVAIWLEDALLEGNSAAPFLVFHAVGVDGIAFDAHKENVYLGNLDYGRIVRVPLRRNGAAGTPTVFLSDPRLIGIDGFAFDRAGTLFAAINGQDRLVAVSPHGRITELAAGDPLDGPSSVAFGTRHGDTRSLYVTSSAFMRTLGFQTGTPHPALQKMDGKHQGLPVP